MGIFHWWVFLGFKGHQNQLQVAQTAHVPLIGMIVHLISSILDNLAVTLNFY